MIALVLVKLNSGGGTAGAASNGPTGAALTTVTKQVTSVPASVTDQVRAAASTSADSCRPDQHRRPPARRSQPGLLRAPSTARRSRRAASPRCCSSAPSTARSAPPSAGRWSMSLSRFGTFTGLTTTHSSSTDTDPNTPTWSRSTRLEVQEPRTSTSPRSRRPPTSARATPATRRPVRQPLQTADVRPAGARSDHTTRAPTVTAARSRSSTWATSTSRSATSRRYGPHCLDGKTWAQVATAMNAAESSAIGKGDARQRELHDRRHLQADEQPAGQRPARPPSRRWRASSRVST